MAGGVDNLGLSGRKRIEEQQDQKDFCTLNYMIRLNRVHRSNIPMKSAEIQNFGKMVKHERNVVSR